MLRLNKNLQTVKLKYILITLFLRRAFSRPFIIILLACHLGPRAPRTDGSLVTGLIFFYGYLVVRFAILGKTGYIAKTIVLTLIAILILIAIDFVNGYRGWSVRYVFPAAIILVDIGILVLMCVNRRNWQSYITARVFCKM